MQYGTASYWEERYSRDPAPFDWYQKWDTIRNTIFDAGVKISDVVLNIGCGTSDLPLAMANDGFHRIMNIDQSNTCITLMQERASNKPFIKFRKMNCQYMGDFKDFAFDFVFDKATLDCVMCGSDAVSQALQLLSEAYRVLSVNGLFICISHASPEYRLPLLQRPCFNWKIRIVKIPKSENLPTCSVIKLKSDAENVHFMYICRKCS